MTMNGNLQNKWRWSAWMSYHIWNRNAIIRGALTISNLYLQAIGLQRWLWWMRNVSRKWKESSSSFQLSKHHVPFPNLLVEHFFKDTKKKEKKNRNRKTIIANANANKNRDQSIYQLMKTILKVTNQYYVRVVRTKQEKKEIVEKHV